VCFICLWFYFNFFLDESKLEVSKFAKNFLPILFNLFSVESDNAKDPVKLAVLETVKTQDVACYVVLRIPPIVHLCQICIYLNTHYQKMDHKLIWNIELCTNHDESVQIIIHWLKSTQQGCLCLCLMFSWCLSLMFS
jgi:hypothetical protein